MTEWKKDPIFDTHYRINDDHLLETCTDLNDQATIKLAEPAEEHSLTGDDIISFLRSVTRLFDGDFFRMKRSEKIKTPIVIGGIYWNHNSDEFSLCMGADQLYGLMDGIQVIDQDVEIGSIENGNVYYLDGYCMGINRIRKQWYIKDTGHRNCKNILASGSYGPDFEESMKPIFKVFMK